MYDVVIAGGGLAGLTSAIQLSKANKSVLLVEKNEYPFHKVCGEYISNEVKPFLTSLGVDLPSLGVSNIQKLTVSSPNGTILNAPLDMGAFGVSRYTLDAYMYKLAVDAGCEVMTGTQVQEINFMENLFELRLSTHQIITARYVIGAYGKRAALDRTLERNFFYNRSPYIGVKYHIHTNYPKDTIALHNFKDGYCGMSAIENNRYCLCYLTTRAQLKEYGSIKELESAVLQKNKYLANLFQNADFIFQSPEVINEVSFARKTAIENHIFMAGDTAGMIAPLCGNGMSMAIHSAKILVDLLLSKGFSSVPREEIERSYARQWHATFARRLWVGRTIQQTFGREIMTDLVVSALSHMPAATKWLIRQTHGAILK